MTHKSPSISTIIPVYNVERYLKATLESVVKQDIGFTDNVEIILVDDGSPDNSAAICQAYVRKYPDNIRYIKQKNSGVSVARNNGLKQAHGKYVHFLDSDDIISRNAYRVTTEFLESHESAIDFATMRLEFFDALLGDHPLNDKFQKGDRVIDINTEPSALVFHATATIFRRDSIRHSFDSSIQISEDVKFLAEQLSDNSSYGVIASATYFYRKRSDGLSAITGSQKNPTFYTVTPHKVYEYMFEILRDGDTVHRYAQHAVMYDMQWRLRQKKQTVITDEEEHVYKNTLYSLLKNIDDDIILGQKNIGLAYKLFALRKKYGSDENVPRETYEKIVRAAKSSSPPVVIEFINNNHGNILIEARVPDGSDAHEITCLVDGKEIEVTRYPVELKRLSFLGDTVYDGCVFRAEIGDESSVVTFKNYANTVQVSPKRFSRLPLSRYGYCILGSNIVVNGGSSIVIESYGVQKHLKYELLHTMRTLMALRLQWSLKELYQIARSHAKSTIPPRQYVKPFILPPVELMRNLRDISWRLLYHLYRPKRPIWILSDRFLAAGDNAEALFDYIKTHEHPDASVYFAISKHVKDFARLRDKYGNSIIDNTTLLYKLRFLRASKIISSHADDFVINPFDWRIKNFYDLFTFDFVFLQHGVTRNDMSGWLNRYNKDIKLFVTVGQQEYNSILEYNYYYRPENVLLSGFPRFDLLENRSQKKIILAPTWRQSLAVEAEDGSGNRPYDPSFKESEYFDFYNTLMNDKQLLDVMRKNGITGEFYLHPSFQKQAKDFTANKPFTIKKFPYDYKTAFAEGSLMITDYSSVFFDFVYLEKPVVFSQFDRDKIFDIHIYQEGYINDIKDGFGPVATNYDDTVRYIKEAIERGFTLEEKYKKRVDKFFEYRDKNNSKRVYNALIELDEK